MKRGKKRLTITNIMKRIREKKAVAVAVSLYLLLDYVQDGIIDGSPLLMIFQWL
jgi:hypothetical protein